MTIDWDFIATLEGMRLDGYVPDPDNSQSGVTIASGVDLGQIGPTLLNSLSPDLQAKLKPYLGMKKKVAVDFLAGHPLLITQTQADELMQAVRASALRYIANLYYTDSGRAFTSLMDAVQTVVASVSFQYGNLAVKTPHFWSVVLHGSASDIVNSLKNFNDKYPTRRNKEAAYLQAKL